MSFRVLGYIAPVAPSKSNNGFVLESEPLNDGAIPGH